MSNPKVLITGGDGDIARAIKAKMGNDFLVRNPLKKEMDVTDTNAISMYLQNYIPDILINNAGYIEPQSLLEREYNHNIDIMTINVNLISVFNLSSQVLKANPYAILVNIGSSAGSRSKANWSSYCASKAGLIMATECWAQEGIKAITVSPGRTKTKMRKRLYNKEDSSLLLDPDEVALVVINAVNGKYSWGKNIDINRNNVREYV